MPFPCNAVLDSGAFWKLVSQETARSSASGLLGIANLAALRIPRYRHRPNQASACELTGRARTKHNTPSVQLHQPVDLITSTSLTRQTSLFFQREKRAEHRAALLSRCAVPRLQYCANPSRRTTISTPATAQRRVSTRSGEGVQLVRRTRYPRRWITGYLANLSIEAQPQHACNFQRRSGVELLAVLILAGTAASSSCLGQ